jgi:hypothetical protein
MSHIAEVNLLVHDLNALHRACQRLGLELVRQQQTYRCYGSVAILCSVWADNGSICPFSVT